MLDEEDFHLIDEDQIAGADRLVENSASRSTPEEGAVMSIGRVVNNTIVGANSQPGNDATDEPVMVGWHVGGIEAEPVSIDPIAGSYLIADDSDGAGEIQVQGAADVLSAGSNVAKNGPAIVDGTDGDDTLTLNYFVWWATGATDVVAHGGDDTILRDRTGGYDSDTGFFEIVDLYGGNGEDTASYIGLGSGVSVDLDYTVDYGVATQISDTTVYSSDRLWNVENVVGTWFDDTMKGDSANNKLWGMDGVDKIYGDAGVDLIWGGNGNDSLFGGDHADKLVGEAGNDKLYGGDGNDDLFGGANTDRLWGHQGDDFMMGGDSGDSLYGGSGKDTAYGGEGYDKLFGGYGNDFLSGDGGNDYAYGGDGNDNLYGMDDNDRLYGADDNDKLFGGSGDDSLFGGEGGDQLWGDADNDKLYGGEGEDVIRTGDGTDSAYGGNHDDTIVVNGTGNNFIHGGWGIDEVQYITTEDVSVFLAAGIANHAGGMDQLSWVENVTTSDGDDVVSGSISANVIATGNGHDNIFAYEGNDTAFAGAGNDTVDGHSGDDVLYGGEDDDQIWGDDGNDDIFGGSGEDWVSGGEGEDNLFGGADADTFFWGAGDLGTDQVFDFTLGQDKLSFGEGFFQPSIGGFDLSEVLFISDLGQHVLLWADTYHSGTQLLAKLHNVDEVEFQQRIDNGTILDVEVSGVGDGAPGGFELGG